MKEEGVVKRLNLKLQLRRCGWVSSLQTIGKNHRVNVWP